MKQNISKIIFTLLGLTLLCTLIPFCIAANNDTETTSTSTSSVNNNGYCVDYEVTTVTSAVSGMALPGALLQLLNTDGNVVYEWTSGTKEQTLNGILEAGATYTLHEKTAPPGYCLADDITFTVASDGSTQNIQMNDAPTDVTIVKYSMLTKNLLPGATLQILDNDGGIVTEWTTDGTATRFQALLNAGETYTLREVSAPTGYVLADDISFTVSTDGSADTICMYNDFTKIEIDKVVK